ncbi:MAG TPA: HD domain-containing protein [Rhizomicrobium sp.]|nr:HD domain-containing protein [Rhizomicrobium sp.]
MRKHPSLLALGLIAVLAAPAAAQTAEPWRAHVTAFTAKLYGPINNTHNQRDYSWAKKLAAIDHVALDDDVIFAAAYLHDVGSMEGWEVKGQEHGDTAAAKLDQMLAGTDFPKAKLDQVREAMRTHMFYRETGPSPEARYLHDADALDNVGTVGIATLLEGVDFKGGPFTSQKAIKILTGAASKIEQGVVTPAGKAEMMTRIAERKAFMNQLARETDNFKEF